ncbi:TPA: hypothetical protein HA278_08285 [Candidatus Woesearchaeota archaeon]|nr:hypothetical protein [archaeon]HIJ12030.1 hypothetical protein [Candidatus Woesearchaeota archaeon]|tara:strand:- start:242 stop:1306 length:1065 start_codon:yes stop_codon:yes gene_type:complete
MVFIGSRSDLSQISDDFKDVWITFVRQFNRTYSPFFRSDLQSNITELTEKTIILQGLILAKHESLSDSKRSAKAKEYLLAINELLKELEEEFREFVDLLPKADAKLNRAVSKKVCKTIIQKIKALIPKTANACMLTSRRAFLTRSAKTLLKGVLYASAPTVSIFATLKPMAESLPLRKRGGLAILVSHNMASEGVLSLFDASSPTQLSWMSGPLYYDAYVYRLEIAFGMKANVVKRYATKDDLFNVLLDPKIDNIVINGHGSVVSWTAQDEKMTSADIWKFAKEHNYPKKKGLFVHHMCGDPIEGVSPKVAKKIVFGQPFYPQSRIKRWEQSITRFDLLRTPLGSKTKQDKLYE